jgi:hypothetical protein
VALRRQLLVFTPGRDASELQSAALGRELGLSKAIIRPQQVTVGQCGSRWCMYVWEQLHVWERRFRAVCAEVEILRIRGEYTKFDTQ